MSRQRSVRMSRMTRDSDSVPAARGGSGFWRWLLVFSFCWDSSVVSSHWVHYISRPTDLACACTVSFIMNVPLCVGEEVRKLKARVDAIDGGGSVASARTSRLSSSSAVNIVDPMESSYVERISGVRADNTINLGSAPGAQDPEVLHRTIQQILRSELQSDTVRGVYHTSTLNIHSEHIHSISSHLLIIHLFAIHFLMISL